jgi:hypothetical protein
MSDDYREIHTSLNLYWSTTWLISKTLIYLTIKYINTSLPNFNWNENPLVSEHQTSDASIGYPPGLTRERLIFFTRNTVNRGFSQKLYLRRNRRNSTIHDSQLFCFTNVQKYRNFHKNTIYRSREFWNNRIPRERK